MGLLPGPSIYLQLPAPPGAWSAPDALPFPRPEPLAQMGPIVLPLSLPRVGDSCPSAWQQSAAHPYLKSTENTALLKFNLLPPQRSTWKLSSAILFMQAQAPHRASWTKAQLTGRLSRPQTPIRGSSSPRSLWEIALRWQNRRTGAQLLSYKQQNSQLKAEQSSPKWTGNPKKDTLLQ